MIQRKKNLGVTLIELMVALAVIAVLAAAGSGSYQTWIQNTKIRTAAESVLNGLQKARAEALRRNARVQFVLTDTNSSWEVGCVTPVGDEDGDGADDCPEIIETRSADDGSAGTIAVTPDDAAGTVIFNSLGVKSGGALTQVSVDSTEISGTDSRDLQVHIGAGGTVRMCDPHAGTDDPRKC